MQKFRHTTERTTKNNKKKKKIARSFLTTNHKLLKSRTFTERWEWNIVKDKSFGKAFELPGALAQFLYTHIYSDLSEIHVTCLLQ